MKAMKEGRKWQFLPFKIQQTVKLDAGNDSRHVLEYGAGGEVCNYEQIDSCVHSNSFLIDSQSAILASILEEIYEEQTKETFSWI